MYKEELMELKEMEMHDISGGAVQWGIVAGVAAAVVYIIGFISGYTNLTRCNN